MPLPQPASVYNLRIDARGHTTEVQMRYPQGGWWWQWYYLDGTPHGDPTDEMPSGRIINLRIDARGHTFAVQAYGVPGQWYDLDGDALDATVVVTSFQHLRIDARGHTVAIYNGIWYDLNGKAAA